MNASKNSAATTNGPQVELQAAETAMSRAYDDMVRARRGVVAEEYLSPRTRSTTTRGRG